jgi:hypothetical protein
MAYKKQSPSPRTSGKQKSTCSPAQYGWIVLFAVNEFTEPVEVFFHKMQGLSTLICEQKEALRRLVHALKGIVCVEGPFTTIETEHEQSIMAASDNSIYGNDPVSVGQQYVVRRAAVSEFISDLGNFCENMYRSLSDEDNRSLEKAIGLLFVGAVEKIEKGREFYLRERMWSPTACSAF